MLSFSAGNILRYDMIENYYTILWAVDFQVSTNEFLVRYMLRTKSREGFYTEMWPAYISHIHLVNDIFEAL